MPLSNRLPSTSSSTECPGKGAKPWVSQGVPSASVPLPEARPRPLGAQQGGGPRATKRLPVGYLIPGASSGLSIGLSEGR